MSVAVADALLRVLSQPAPQLERLSILIDQTYRLAALPQDFLAGQAPRLTTLKLIRCTIPWSSRLISPGLRAICFDNVCLTTGARAGIKLPFSDGNVFKAIRRLPGITSLVLKGAIPPSPHTDIPLSLPFLQDIHVETTILSMKKFLSHIHLSSQAHLSVRCHAPGRHDRHPWLGLTAQLRRLQTEIAPVVAAELSFLAVCGDTFNVHGYRTAAAYTRHHIDIQCFVRDRRSWDKIFEPVLYVLPPDLAHLRVTTTRVDEMIPPALWCLIFGYFRTLETLELRGEAYFSFLATFDADPGPDTDADDGYYTDADANAVLAALFNASVGPPENLCTRWPPKIRTLTITRVNFAVARGHDERTIPRSFKALLRVVRMVHDGGMAMTELRFAQCRGLLSSHTQELAKFVPVISCEDSVDSTFGLHHEYDSGDNDLEDPHFWRE